MPSSLEVHMAEPMSLDGTETQEAPPHVPQQPSLHVSSPLQTRILQDVHPEIAAGPSTAPAAQQPSYGTRVPS
jgi:hypothetical protein